MSLQSFSDSELLSRTQNLAEQERELTLLVLVHLNEIERRRLHLKLGYSSLFDYCTSKLGYSASAAVRRIRTARCVARFPGICEPLQKNQVNLSTIAQVYRILTPQNHEAIISRIRGKSQREVETILAAYQPRASLRDRVRTVVVRVPTPEAPLLEPEVTASPANTAASASACEKSAYRRSGCASDDVTPVPVAPAHSQVPVRQSEVIEQRTVLQFSVRPGFMTKLDRVRTLVWHRLPANPSLEQLFELVLDHLIEKEDPAARIERRNRRVGSANGQGIVGQVAAPGSASHARHVPVPVRDRIFERDGSRCTYVGTEGRRCNATRALQVDHITPVARGGASTPDNLRILCAHHNRLEAARLLGPLAERNRTEHDDHGPP